MNNYIAFEISEFQKKLNGYNMLFNYRMSNLCVKVEPTALMPVTVILANAEYNLEEVADIIKVDDFSIDVYPKNQNNLQQVIDGIFDVHPEFKMELKTDKAETEGGEDKHHAFYTMPEVNKERRDLLNDLTKTFHKECQLNLDATYAELQVRLMEPYTKMSPAEIDEARQGFENIFNKAKEMCDKLLQLKLNEIEEGYQRYFEGENDRYDEPDADDDEMEISHDAEIEALFS
jgi:hypothetical protein